MKPIIEFTTICLWEWKPDAKSFRSWSLVKAITDFHDEPDFDIWQTWVFPGENEDDYDRLRGHAATSLILGQAVVLLGIVPPADVPDWLTPFLSNQIKTAKNWYEFLKDGVELSCGTCDAAMAALRSLEDGNGQEKN